MELRDYDETNPPEFQFSAIPESRQQQVDGGTMANSL
jgi:hypothetical protein